MSSFKIDPKLKVGLVTLAANDIEMLSRYYQTVIGLSLIEKGSDRVLLGVDETALLELVASPGGRQFKKSVGLFHIALLVPNRADLGHWLQHYIDSENQMVGGAGDHLVSEALYLNDPEGNGIEVYRDRPRSEWRTSGEGHIEMATLSVDIPGVLEAAPKTPFTGLPTGTTMGHIHLQVSAIPESINFYRDALGITQTDRQEFNSAAFFGAGGYHHHIGNNIWHSGGASRPPAGSLGLQQFELTLSSPNEVSRLLDHLDHTNTQVTTLENDRVAVTDPSGNKIILKG